MLTSELLLIPAAICPDRAALVSKDASISFAELEERSTRLANALALRGVGNGMRAAVLQVNCPEYAEIYIALAKLGAVMAPLNFRATADELRFMLEAAGCQVLFVGERYRDLVDAFREELSPAPAHLIALTERGAAPIGKGGAPYEEYDEVLTGGGLEPVTTEAQDTDTTILMFTAGTTGRPKGVMLTHNSFSLYMLENVAPADPERAEVSLLVIPLYHVAGIQSVLSSIYGGRTTVVRPQFDPEEWLNAVEQERVTHSVVVPTMLKQVIDHPHFADRDLSSLRQITYGAASMPLDVIVKAVEALPHVGFINAFGQTETASTVTVLGPEDHDLAGSGEERARKLQRLAGSIGKALPGVEVCIMDDSGHRLAPEAIGNIAVRGPRIMAGYWNDSGATSATIRGGWVFTGDLGWADDDGYFYLTGRAKDVIKRGGELISPEEIENVIDSHPAVDEVAVIGAADEEWGEQIRAIVVLRPGRSVSEAELIDHCRRRLASFKKPESVLFVDNLPRNEIGKVLKEELRERYGRP